MADIKTKEFKSESRKALNNPQIQKSLVRVIDHFGEARVKTAATVRSIAFHLKLSRQLLTPPKPKLNFTTITNGLNRRIRTPSAISRISSAPTRYSSQCICADPTFVSPACFAQRLRGDDIPLINFRKFTKLFSYETFNELIQT